MEKNVITIIDSVHCKASKLLIKAIKPCLAYTSSFWKQGPYKKTQKVQEAYLIDGRSGLFLSGLLPKVEAYLTSTKIKYVVKDSFEILALKREAKLKGITFRDDQLEAIKAATVNQRGIIKALTGSGKTVVAMGIISRYPNSNILILAHTLDLIKQLKIELEKFGFKYSIPFSIGKEKNIFSGKERGIIISTIQTFSKIDPKEYIDSIDIILVDEAHHVISEKSQYGKVLRSCLAPIKIGFTATLPDKKKEKMIMEGLLGPVISELTIDKGIALGIVAKPVIKMIAVPYSVSIAEYKKYKDLYQYGIVENRVRSKLIVNEVIDNIKSKKSTLIMIENIEQAIILSMLFKNNGITFKIVVSGFGSEINKRINKIRKKIKTLKGNRKISKEVKDKNIKDYNLEIEDMKPNNLMEDSTEVKNKLERKEILCVICSKKWREGINIPSLNCIIIASGGKGETKVLQGVGRALRKTEEKDEISIIDFLDPYRYLAEHAIKRLGIYIENNWEIIFKKGD